MGREFGGSFHLSQPVVTLIMGSGIIFVETFFLFMTPIESCLSFHDLVIKHFTLFQFWSFFIQKLLYALVQFLDSLLGFLSLCFQLAYLLEILILITFKSRSSRSGVMLQGREDRREDHSLRQGRR